MDLTLNKYLTIQDYLELIDLNNKEIILKKIIIKGENLYIKYLDKSTIVISGKIKEILLKDDIK